MQKFTRFCDYRYVHFPWPIRIVVQVTGIRGDVIIRSSTNNFFLTRTSLSLTGFRRDDAVCFAVDGFE